MTRISLTPIIDVVFILLIFFMLASNFNKIGELKIKELRAISENKLGDRFDIKEFHHEVLRHGGIPLYVLEENINSWINQQIN